MSFFFHNTARYLASSHLPEIAIKVAIVRRRRRRRRPLQV